MTIKTTEVDFVKLGPSTGSDFHASLHASTVVTGFGLAFLKNSCILSLLSEALESTLLLNK